MGPFEQNQEAKFHAIISAYAGTLWREQLLFGRALSTVPESLCMRTVKGGKSALRPLSFSSTLLLELVGAGSLTSALAHLYSKWVVRVLRTCAL